MLGSRFTLGCVGALTIAFGATWACIPHPEQDFEDYQERIATFPKPVVEASTFEAAPPPTQAVEGTYYGGCLPELALGSVNQRLNFFTVTKFSPSATGGQLQLTLQPLAHDNRQPPATVSKANAVGAEIPTPLADVAASGRFRLDLGTINILGAANPVSGGDIEILGAFLEGRFAETRFCGRLGGQLVKPAAAARTLDPPQNICHFIPIKDGDTMPELTFADFQPESCPLE